MIQKEKIRVIVVDDSAFMRKALSIMLEEDPDIQVIATGRDGLEAIELVKKHKPDLLTLDIEMPRMDGLTALKKIMAEDPLPIIVVSSLTQEGAKTTMEALDAGAVDFIPKQLSFVSLDIVKIKQDLLEKVKHFARKRRIIGKKLTFSSVAETREVVNEEPLPRPRTKPGIVAIGVSTGGPPALQKLIPALDGNLPVGVLIAQHMPPRFTRSLAERLDRLSSVSVKEAEDGDVIEPGYVYIAQGGKHMTVKRIGARIKINISEEPKDALYKPSVDLMFTSVANTFGSRSLGIILTGMGKDGLEGCKLIKQKGGYVIAQEGRTCVVYGMPKAVIDDGLADRINGIDYIADDVNRIFNQH